MDVLTIPPLQIDPLTLPAPILTSEPGSFAYNTLKVRIPGIIDDIVASNSFPPEVTARILELRAEIVGGRIRPLVEEAPDVAFWNALSREYLGHTWLDAPWYWAETYFYRRMLEATGYFQPGPMHRFDPYRAKKEAELAPHVAPRAVAALLRTQASAGRPADGREQAQAFFYASLWGNRIDLSYNVSAQVGRGEQLEDERAYLLVDDAARVCDFIAGSHRPRLALIADNAGTELSMDLALIDFLLSAQWVDQVTLHLKAQPFFVSDAMPADVDAAVEALAGGEVEAQALAARLRAAVAEGRLVLSTHWFYTTGLFYFQMPADLRSALASADFVILKGDANYRRLLGDAHWPPATSFAHVTRYFPAPLLALRTLKAEEIVGLREGEAEALSRVDPNWMVNGKRGIVQARL